MKNNLKRFLALFLTGCMITGIFPAANALSPTDATATKAESITVENTEKTESIPLDKLPLQFSASVFPAETEQTVDWSVVCMDRKAANPSITADGKFTTDVSGVYVVTASARDNSGVIGEYAVAVLEPTPESGEDEEETTSAWTVDADTKCNWASKYGTDGYVLVGWNNKVDYSELPDYIESISYTGQFAGRTGTYVATGATDAVKQEYGLAPKNDPADKKISYYFDDYGFTIHLKAKDEQPHTVTLYVCAENSTRDRRQSVQIFNAGTTTAQTDAIEMNTLNLGRYISATFVGSVDILVDSLVDIKYTNALVNGIFFDKASGAPVQDISVDTSDGRTQFALGEGEVQMQATVTPTDAANKNVVWSVSPTDGAAISESGKLTVSKGGTYTVTAVSQENPSVSASKEIRFIENLPVWTADTATKGDWMKLYGKEGYILNAWDNKNDSFELPYYIETYEYFTVSGARSGGYVARNAATQGSNSWWPSGLAHPNDPDGTRKIAYFYDDNTFTTRLTVLDDNPHQLTLYSVSENDTGRQQKIQIFRAGTKIPLTEPVIMDSIASGEYVTVSFSGDIDIVFTNLRTDLNVNGTHKTNALVNGIFFDTPHPEETVPVQHLAIAPADGQTIRRVGEQPQMEVIALFPTHAASTAVTWAIPEEYREIAMIDETGKLTVRKAGLFAVTATSETLPSVTSSVYMMAENEHTVPPQTTLNINEHFAQIENAQVRFVFDLQAGTYSIYKQTDGKPYVLNAYFMANQKKSTANYAFTAKELTASDSGKTIRLTGIRDGQDDLLLDISLENEAGDILMRAGITNRSDKGKKLMQMYPLVTNAKEKGGIFVGPDPEQHHALLSGEGNWTAPRIEQDVSTSSKNNLILSYRNQPEAESFLLGQLTTFSFQSTINTNFNRSSAFANHGRKSIDADIRIYDNTGKLVDAGQSYVGDTALINFTTENPYDSLEQYAKRQADVMDVQLLEIDPYIYECLWYVSWFTKNANNADYAVQELEYIHNSGLSNYAVPNLRVEPDTYTQINEQLWWDDAHWLDFGHLTETYPTMKAWIAAMKAAGGDGGTYFQASYRNKDYCEQFPEHMMHNLSSEGPDYTDPGFIAHMANVYFNLKEAGLRSIFYDFAGQYKGTGASYLLDKTNGFEDEHATAVEAYRNIHALPKTYVGRDVRITENSWEYSGSDVAIGLIDIQRTVMDTNTFSPEVALNAVNQWYRHRTTKILYSDVKVFEKDHADLRRAQITGTGFFFGKTTLGESVTRLNQETIQEIGKIVPFPVDGISARPVGLFERNYKTNPYVYDYEFDSEYDDHILLFWNQDGNGEKVISADLGLDTAFGGVGLDPDKEYEIWDFWDWKYVDRVRGDEVLSLKVRDLEMKTLAVREVRKVPYLLSTNRHVLQGVECIDVEKFDYDASANTIRGTFDIVGNDPYKAIISLNDCDKSIVSLQIDNQSVSGNAKLNRKNNTIELTLSAKENQTVSFALQLQNGQTADTEAPAAVSGLRALADNFGQVTLCWEESTDNDPFTCVYYDVYVGETADFAAEAAAEIAQTLQPTFTDTTVRSGDVYYKIIARDIAGNVSTPTGIKTNTQVLQASADTLTMTAGDQYAGEEADKAIDGISSTFWHTAHSTTANRDNFWLDMKFSAPTTVNTYEYLPRNSRFQNGVYTKYKLTASSDNGATYFDVAQGNWEETLGWKTIEFNDITVTNLRLTALESVGTYASAAEVKAYRKTVIETVEFHKPAVTLKTGDRCVLAASIYPTNLADRKITFTTENSDIVTVDEQGNLTALAVGVAAVTATADGKSDTCTVVVREDCAGEHSWDEGTVTTGPTCGKKGVKTFTCGVCGQTKTEEVPATGKHTAGAWVTVVKPTASATGLSVQNCTVCGAEMGRKTLAKTGDPCEKFTDINRSAWYHKAVDYAVENNLFKGTTETTFAPNMKMTRGMFVTVLGRLNGVNAEKSATKFKDVKASAYYSGYVKWASEVGIVNGTSATTFAPDMNITREQICKMMVGYCKYAKIELKALNAAVTFKDAGEISGWAKQYVTTCQRAGLVNGSGDRFNPKNDASRVEVAQILMNFAKRYLE